MTPLLDQGRPRYAQFATSFAIQIVLILCVIVAPMFAMERMEAYRSHTITMLVPISNPPVAIRERRLPAAPPIPTPTLVAPPRILVPALRSPAEKHAPRARVEDAPEPARTPSVAVLAPVASVIPALAKPRPDIRTGDFSAATPVEHAQIAQKQGPAAATGAFGDGPATLGQPGGSGASTGKSVQIGGFGQGAPDGVPGGHGTGRGVTAAGFDAGPPVDRAGVRPIVAVESHTTPVKILSEPRPQYTPEGRAAKVEGDVVLEVVFAAEGKVEVIRVVHELDFGLTAVAEIAARGIQFRPATRDGQPVDQSAVIHVSFRIAE